MHTVSYSIPCPMSRRGGGELSTHARPALGVSSYPPTPCGQTDACEYITFQQLRLRAVNIINTYQYKYQEIIAVVFA